MRIRSLRECSKGMRIPHQFENWFGMTEEEPGCVTISDHPGARWVQALPAGRGFGIVNQKDTGHDQDA